MILSAAADQGHFVPWLLLLFASASVILYSGIKIPLFTFFAHDSGIRVQEAPINMLLSMGIAASFCVGIGIFPDLLYMLLPYPVDYKPYTTYHVVNQLQLLLFSALAFAWLMRSGIYPPELRSTNLDFDVVYRRMFPAALKYSFNILRPLDHRVREIFHRLIQRTIARIYRVSGPSGSLARAVGTGSMVFWVLAMLFSYLIVSLTGS